MIKTRNLLSILLWIALILILSSTPNLHLSVLVSDIAHTLVYAILAALIWSGTKQLCHRKWVLIAACIIFCSALAILDELNQTHVLGRTGDPIDFLMDSIGIWLAISIFLVIRVIKGARWKIGRGRAKLPS